MGLWGAEVPTGSTTSWKVIVLWLFFDATRQIAMRSLRQNATVVFAAPRWGSGCHEHEGGVPQGDGYCRRGFARFRLFVRPGPSLLGASLGLVAWNLSMIRRAEKVSVGWDPV